MITCPNTNDDVRFREIPTACGNVYRMSFASLGLEMNLEKTRLTITDEHGHSEYHDIHDGSCTFDYFERELLTSGWTDEYWTAIESEIQNTP